MKKLSKILLLSVLSIFLVAGSAMALPILELFDGTNKVTINDNSGSDLLPTDAGAVVYSGSIGSFTLNVTTGITKPYIGAADYPILDLNSVTVSGGSGTLTIKWTEKDFTLPDTIPGFVSFIGGSTTGAVTLDTYLDMNNLIFGTDTPLSQLGLFNTLGFSDDDQVVINPNEPFSLTIVARITHDNAGDVTSFNAGISPVPEPATMLLLGAGLIGIAAFGRKKFFK